jgi:uncharacterized protein (DUF1810 family)
MMNSDPYDLQRFVTAQELDYRQALAEIKAGRKKSHWMWFVFPQFDGLGSSPTSRHYSIKSVDEAKAYLSHPILGPRLLECVRALLDLHGRTARQIFDVPDDLKLRSCVTLFSIASPPDNVFERILEKYFAGERDVKTLQLINVEG